jgi:putative PIN family toxin of toxin-antitoxin system
MRIVIDTSVIVKAVRNFRGASAALVDAAVAGRVTALVSTPLGLEYEAVIKRPAHWVWPGFGAVEADRFLDILANVCEPVDIRFRWRGFLPDPDDDMVIEAAINGGADMITTFNERDFAPASAQFGLVIVRPDAILAALRNRP